MQKTERNTNKNKRESKIKTVCSKTNRKRKKRTALNVNLLAMATIASDLTICWSVYTSLDINSWNWLFCLVNYSKIGLPKIKQQYTKCNVRSLDDQIHKQDYKVLSINIEIHNDAWHIGKCIYYDANIKHIYVGARIEWTDKHRFKVSRRSILEAGSVNLPISHITLSLSLLSLQSLAQKACDLCGRWGSIANGGSRHVGALECAAVLEHEVLRTNHTRTGQSPSAR